MDDFIEELTKILIKQHIKDKKEGTEYIKISKANLIKQNIRLLKFVEKNKSD